METLYWLCEYGKVFCGYTFFMFIWPFVVFCRHLKGKDKIYQFSFCVVVQVVIANTVVLTLGLLHVLNQWVVKGIFYGVFFISIISKFNFRFRLGMFQGSFTSIWRLLMGTCGIKLFLYQAAGRSAGWLKKKFLLIWRGLKPHLLEYIVLLGVVLYGMIYFSWGSLQAYGYAFSDLYVHHQWVYGLIKGEIFAGKIYPEAMHCFVYCLHTLFGIRVYSCLQLLGGIHIAVFLLCAYSLIRESFQWKYTPIFVLVIFLMLDTMQSLNFIVCMSRLQSVLPQEFGFYTQFVCALFLFRYLNSTHRVKYKEKLSRFYWDKNLFLFMMSLAASIAIHFYTTIMAFFLCASFALFGIRRIFTKERFFPLVVAAVCGFLIAALPMAGALASGKVFHGSIGWALGVMEGDKSEDTDRSDGETEKDDIELSEQGTGQENKKEANIDTLLQKLENKCLICFSGLKTLYGEQRAKYIVLFMELGIVLLIIYRMGRFIWEKILKHQVKKKCFDGHLPLIFAAVIFVVLSKASALGLPQLIDSTRLYSIEHLLLLTAAAMPADMIFTLFGVFCKDGILQILSVSLTIGIGWAIVVSDNYHGFLGEYLTRYDSAVNVTNSIIDNFPEEKYTIVSPVDELYQVAQYGYHEELLTFVQKIQEKDYKLPTEYVFLFIEKRSIEYAQVHLFQGPSWLGGTKYADRYPSISVHPDTVAREISKEYAKSDVILYDRPSQSYSELESRVVLESKAYLWCQNFSKLYPFVVNVYYEDENFVCYYFKQNPYALYDLAIEGWDRTDGIQWQEL